MSRTMIFQIQYSGNRTVSRAAANINERNVGNRTFTLNERTVARHDKKFVVQQVKSVLRGAPVCVNALNRYADDDLFTTAAVDEMVGEIVAESRFFNQ